jgi:hypothetical protein
VSSFHFIEEKQIMPQPWHTEGYIILADAIIYLIVSRNLDVSVEKDAMAILRDAGKKIRREHEPIS